MIKINTCKELLGTLTWALPSIWRRMFLFVFFLFVLFFWEGCKSCQKLISPSLFWVMLSVDWKLFPLVNLFSVPSCLEKLLEWWVVAGGEEGRSSPPQSSILYQCLVDVSRTACHCMIYLFFVCFFRTVYRFVLWYCHSKEKAKLYKVSDTKRKKWLF